VTGASGMLGRAVVPELLRRNLEVRAASRRPHESKNGVEWVVADVVTGEGVRKAVAGVGTVIHLAAAPYKGRYTENVEVDGTKRLLREAPQAHIIYVSIVGVNRVPWGYFRTKLKAEEVLKNRPNVSIIRATQFFGFTERPLRLMAKLGIMVVDPGIKAQPVDVHEVAQRVCERVEQGPSGGIEEFGGPEILDTEVAMRQWLHAKGMRRPILRVKLPGRLGRAFREGGLTTPVKAGTKTWQEYLR
jgi:uncharacterized protein YbjT (DUF2867 family)